MSLFKKKSTDFDEHDKQVAPKSRGSLLVLLILLGGLAYLYFFTSLIVPHEAPPSAKAPDAAVEVKQSMPPKTAASPAPQTGTPTASPAPAPAAAPAAPAVPAPGATKPAAPATAAKPVVPATAAKPVVPAVPAPAAATKPAAPAAAKPVVPAAAVPVTGKTVPPAAAQKPAAVKPVTAAARKEAVPVKKEAAKVEGQITGKTAEKQPAPAAIKAEAKHVKPAVSSAAKPGASKKPELYTILVGEFPSGDEAAVAEAKVARLGVKPISKNELKKNKTMNRLYYGAYTDYDLYAANLEKLRQSAKGAFGVEKDGTYFLYAGSFSAKERVEKEKRDLAAKGVTLQIQQTVLSLATVKLTAGRFTSKQEADKAAAKMKGEGLAAKVVSAGR